MIFKYALPTKVIFGQGCLRQNKEELLSYGNKAFIVTGSTSGRLSGALDDIISVYNEKGIKYYIFDKVENNPTLDNVAFGSVEAKKFGADVVIGVGGGSPIDAAKAIAVLVTNDIEPLDLYTNKFENKPLPIIAVPTTAGTGSEVTPYSILTRKDIETKRSFGNEDTFPKLAIMDPTYTMSLSREVTINTAIDALSHGVEAYLSKRSTPISDVFARQCIKEFADTFAALQSNEMDYEARRRLLYCSMLGGMAIAHTGTTIVHAMGYSLTYFRGIPHGKANGLLMKEYFSFNYQACQAKIDDILTIMRFENINDFGNTISELLGSNITYTDEELKKYADFAMTQNSVAYNPIVVKKEDLYAIMKKSLTATLTI